MTYLLTTNNIIIIINLHFMMTIKLFNDNTYQYVITKSAKMDKV